MRYNGLKDASERQDWLSSLGQNVQPAGQRCFLLHGLSKLLLDLLELTCNGSSPLAIRKQPIVQCPLLLQLPLSIYPMWYEISACAITPAFAL